MRSPTLWGENRQTPRQHYDFQHERELAYIWYTYDLQPRFGDKSTVHHFVSH